MSDIVFKELNADSLFDFVEVINAIGVDEFLSAFEMSNMSFDSKNQEEFGAWIVARLVGSMIKNLSKAKEYIYRFLANNVQTENGEDVSVEQLRALKPAKFIRLIKEFFLQEDLHDFFEEVAELLDSDRKSSKN